MGKVTERGTVRVVGPQKNWNINKTGFQHEKPKLLLRTLASSIFAHQNWHWTYDLLHSCGGHTGSVSCGMRPGFHVGDQFFCAGDISADGSETFGKRSHQHIDVPGIYSPIITDTSSIWTKSTFNQNNQIHHNFLQRRQIFFIFYQILRSKEIFFCLPILRTSSYCKDT